MNIKIQINGLDKLHDLLDRAERQSSDLRATISEIEKTAHDLEVELNQPTAGTIG